MDRLHEVFSVVETPAPGQHQLYTDSFNDYIVENPFYPPNPSIGNGEFWYVKLDDDEIWYVRYNYNDGADRRFNNIYIDCELKAIGKMIAYDKDVEDLLQQLKKHNEERGYVYNNLHLVDVNGKDVSVCSDGTGLMRLEVECAFKPENELDDNIVYYQANIYSDGTMQIYFLDTAYERV